MLILTVRPGESLVTHDADGKISTTTVLGVSGNIVRIGIEADDWVNIDRETVYKRKMQELEK